MIAIDTNMVVRLITRDDDLQYHKAKVLLEEQEVLIVDTVVLESVWVLGYAYGYDRQRIFDALSCLFGLPNVHLFHPDAVADALSWYGQGMDFADALHLSGCRSTRAFYTFDKKFIKKAKGLKLKPPVQLPVKNS
ncbi:type II toxin-antitoxin system VapC family toxin [Mariprofundus erugo]|nr:type II toxin-antitoxin system VapC family toxin [Mariprofundus erugo]TLS78468.1 type II toxin-antitoxin system VapC family toxin [Mariprofundus erugo]